MDLKKGILLAIAVITLSIFGASAVSIISQGISDGANSLSLAKLVLAEGGDGPGDGAGSGDGGGCCGSVDDGAPGGDAPGGDVPPPPPPQDFCPNLAGIQTSVPAGYFVDANGNCVQDFCPNLPGNQTALPPGYFVDANGNCVQDFCPNLSGNQASVPPGYYVDANGNCVQDKCPNLPGNQTAVPPGYFIDENGNCVTTQDYCPNLPGNQTSVPPGYTVDANGNCVTTQDFCPNLPGVQDVLPPGYFKDANGNCVTITDVCPNIAGNQATIPDGLIKDSNGNCVPPPCVTNCTPPPCTVNCGGGGIDQPNVFLFRKPGEQPLAFVTLAQIPYTGYEAGPWGVALFWMFLAIWSAFAAYLIAVKRIPQRLVEKYLVVGGVGVHELPHIDAHDDEHVPPMTHLSSVKPAVLESTMALPRHSYVAPAPKIASRVVETPVSFSTADTDYVSAVPQFIGWIAKGESDKAFDFLRNLRLTKQSAQAFLEKAVCDLDDAYRCRIDGTEAKATKTANAISHLSNTQVEQLIDALAQGVDRSYGSDYTQAKIALIKALGVSGMAAMPQMKTEVVVATPVVEMGIESMVETENPAPAAEVKTAPAPAFVAMNHDYVDDFIKVQIEKNRR